MNEDEEDKKLQKNSPGSPSSLSQTDIDCTKSQFRLDKKKYQIYNRNDISSAFHSDCIYSSTSKTEPNVYESVEAAENRYKLISKDPTMKKGKIFSNPDFMMKEYWKTTSGEMPMKLIELFRDRNSVEELGEDEEGQSVPVKKMKLNMEEENEMLSYTKEFHVLTEVQKAKILNVVEDTIKKLANSDFNVNIEGTQKPSQEDMAFAMLGTHIDRYFYKKFLLPWVFMKVLEMVLCHLIQITFLSSDSFLEKKGEFLPVIVTFYLTLFVVVLSLVLHVSCYSCIGIQNPCYFMGVISSSVLTLTTSSGIFVLLCSMEFYKSFTEILVLVFISGLLSSLIAELCLFYVEVKNFWNMMGPTDQYYIP